MHRLKPALALFLLAPLIGEFLLGSIPFSQVWLFPVMAPMYGGGALLIREAARRTGRGWPTILTLGLAYGLIEEGLATQSLFNPDYLGLRLLDNGFIPQFGIGAPWTAYVLILHVIWSIAVPIGLVEWLFPDQRTTPWLKNVGCAVTLAVYCLGVWLITFGTHQKENFIASTTQLTVTAVLALLSIVAAFVLFSAGESPESTPQTSNYRNSLGLTALSFVAGSAFQLITQLGSGYFGPWISVPILIAIPTAVCIAAYAARSSGVATESIADALMLGALAAYCWLGFFLTARLHGRDTLSGQIVPCAIILAIVAWRLFRRPTAATS